MWGGFGKALSGAGNFLKGLPGKMSGGPMAQGGEGIPSVMGFPAMPGGAQRQVPQGANKWAQRLDIIGSGLREMGGEQGQLAGARDRIAGAAKAQQMAALRESLPPDQQRIFDLSPELWAQQFGKPKEEPGLSFHYGDNGAFTARDPRTGQAVVSEPGTAAPPKPRQRERGPDGIYELQDDGSWKKVASFGAAPRTFAPPRRSGGSAPRSSGGGSPAMDAIAAELRRRGKL
jgi:hypothetical protein